MDYFIGFGYHCQVDKLFQVSKKVKPNVCGQEWKEETGRTRGYASTLQEHSSNSYDIRTYTYAC